MTTIVSYVTALAILFILNSGLLKSETDFVYCPTPCKVTIATNHGLPNTDADKN